MAFEGLLSLLQMSSLLGQIGSYVFDFKDRPKTKSHFSVVRIGNVAVESHSWAKPMV